MLKRGKGIKLICSFVFCCIIFINIGFKDVLAVDNENNSFNTTSINEENMIQDEETNNKLNNLYNYINNIKSDVEIMNDLDPVQYIKEYIKNGESSLSIKEVSNALLSFAFKEVKTVLSLSISIIVLALICSLLKNLQSAFSNESISNVAFFACYSILIIILSRSFIVSITIAVDIIKSLSDFMGAVMPVLVMMLGTIGGFSQAATMDPIIMAATIFVPRIYTSVIIPLILITFVLEFTNNISTEYKISNLCKLTKQITVWMQGIILTLFIGLLTVRGITASTIDAVTLKTAKFAIDNFIPIVGKAFSDAIASVAGYSLIIKNAVSTIGLVVIVLIMLYPVIKLLLISFVYKLTAALIEPISDKRITSSIASAGDSLILIMSCVLSVSLMFFVLLAIMASAGKFVIGGWLLGVEEIKGFVITLVTMLILISAIELISPENSMKKYIRFVLGCILIAVMISPLINFLGDGEELLVSKIDSFLSMPKEETEVSSSFEESKDTRSEVVLNNIEYNLNRLLKEQYSDSDFKVKIQGNIDMDNIEYSIEKIEVGVKDKGILNIEKIVINEEESTEVSTNSENVKNKHEIIGFLKDTLKISEDKISVYRLN